MGPKGRIKIGSGKVRQCLLRKGEVTRERLVVKISFLPWSVQRTNTQVWSSLGCIDLIPGTYSIQLETTFYKETKSGAEDTKKKLHDARTQFMLHSSPPLQYNVRNGSSDSYSQHMEGNYGVERSAAAPPRFQLSGPHFSLFIILTWSRNLYFPAATSNSSWPKLKVPKKKKIPSGKWTF